MSHTHCGRLGGNLAVFQCGLTLIARFMGPTWGPSGADRTQVGPMLAPWTLLSGDPQNIITSSLWSSLWPSGASLLLTEINWDFDHWWIITSIILISQEKRGHLLTMCHSIVSTPSLTLVTSPFSNATPIDFEETWSSFYYPQPIWSTVCPSVCLSIPPVLPLYSPQYSPDRIPFIFGTVIDLSRSINAIDYRVSMFIFLDPVAFWNFITMTDFLDQGRPRVPILWTAFLHFV